MICACVKNLLEPHVRGRLVGWQSRWVSEHLEQCAGCRAEAELWRRMSSGLRALPQPRAAQQLKARLREVLARPAARTQRPAEVGELWSRPLPVLALAWSFAAFLLSVSASILGPGLPTQGCSDSPLSVCVPLSSSKSVTLRTP